MTLTLHDIKVWNTGEVIDLVVPSDTDASVDASAMTIAPGFEDPHVHFRDPGQTYKESMISGCAAAASGGYTNVLIMPNTVPAMDGLQVHEGEPGAQEILDADLYFIEKIGLRQHLSPTRSNGLLSMVKQIKSYAIAYKAKEEMG